MGQPLALRSDYDATTLRGLARQSREAAPARRLLALAAIYDGASRTEAARLGSVTLQIVRDWVLRFNGTGPDGLIDRKAPGQKSRLTDAHRAALAEIIERGPTPAVHGVVRWRIVDLCQWLWEEFQVSVAKQTLSKELRAMGGAAEGSTRRGGWNGSGGFRKLSARPRHHAQAEGAVEHFKKASPAHWRRSRENGVAASNLELWFGDQARVARWWTRP